MSQTDTTLMTAERPWLSKAARLLSRQVNALIREDWANKRLVVSHAEGAVPKTWMGYPIVRRDP